MTTSKSEVSRNDLFSIFARFRELALIGFILLLVIIISLSSRSFLTLSNFSDILLDISILAMIALAQGMIIITRGIDLSVASALALTAMMVAFVLQAFPGTPLILIVLLGVGLGIVLGSLNGIIIAVGKVPPIIATLGTLSIYRGLVFLYSNGDWVNPIDLPSGFKQLAKGTPLGLPNLVIIAIGVAIVAYVFLNHIQAGRDIYAVGTNFEAADLGHPHPADHFYGLRHLWNGLRVGRGYVGLALRSGADQHRTRV